MKRLIHGVMVLAPLAMLLWSANAQAVTQTGQVTGYVSDQSGMPVPDVRIEVAGENLIGGKRSTTTNEDGEFRFLQLPPGMYKVVATHELYRRVTMDKVAVQINRTASVDIVLEPPVAAEAEAYVVKGTVPVVDVERTTLGNSVSASFTETIPTSRDYQGMAQLVPGVVGGANPNVHGATLYGNQYFLDGINITDPVTNTFSANFNFDAIQEVEVLTGVLDAEYGSAQGGIINIVTKSGGNEFTADASIYYSSAYLQWREKGEEELNNQMLQLSLNVGGPIIKDRLWFFVSGEVPWAIQTLPPTAATSDIFPDQAGKLHPSRDFRAFYGLAKLTWQPFSNQTFKFLLQGDPTTIYNEGQSPSIHPDAETQRYQGGVIASVASETFVLPELFLNNRLAYTHGRLFIYPQSNDFDTPGRGNTATGTATVNDTTWLDDNRYRVQLHSSATYTLDNLIGEHQFKAGVDASLTINTVFDSLPGGGSYTDNGLDPTNPNSASGAGLPYQYTRLIESQDTVIYGDTVSVFVQDKWKPFPSLTVRPGLRMDSARMRNFEGVAQVQINTLSPRLAVSWDPFDDNKTALRAGYGQYVDTGYLALSDFAGGKGKLTHTYEYNPITEEYDIYLYEEGGANGVEGKDYLKDMFDQRRPRVHELNLGVSRELITDLGFSADFIYRFYGNQWEDDEINAQWNEDGDAVIGFNNGEQKYIYSLGALDEAFIRYYGFEFALNKRFSSNWEMMASYTWSWTEGTEPSIISVAFDRPRQREYEFGFLPQDVRHVLKIYGSYRLPYGFVVGGRVRYQSGGPYNRYYFNSFYSDYEDRRAPRGFDRQDDGTLVELRYPDTFTVNARVTWQLQELTGQKLDLICEVFNLLNARTPAGYETRNLPAGGATQFGDVTDKLDPLNVQLGLRYRF
ncbi:MAG: TonB-dependent receptor [Pseudomonadota bacterium]